VCVSARIDTGLMKAAAFRRTHVVACRVQTYPM